MQLKQLALAAALSLATASAFAGNWYVAGSVGATQVSDDNKSSLDSSLASAGATGISSSLDNNDTGYKLQLGYQFTPNLAVEGGWVDLGRINYNASFTGGSANATWKASGFNVAAVGIWPLNPQWSLFGKLGVIDAKLEANVSASGPGGSATGSASNTDWKGNYGIGVAYNFNPQVSVRGELERFDNLGNGTTGHTDVDMLSVGVVFKF